MSFSSMFMWKMSIMMLKFGRSTRFAISASSSMVLMKFVCMMVTASSAIFTFFGAA